MPKIAKELSALEVSRLNKTGFNAVGVVPGLGLQIRGQARSWILRVKIADKVRDIGLGGYPGVTLAMAREAARQLRSKIAAGIDPIQERKDRNAELRAAQRKRLLFVDACRQFLEDKQSEWGNAKHRQQWENTLRVHALPVLGNLAVDDIELAHVLEVLKPIWHKTPETAKRTRGRIEKVLDWAKVHGHRDGENPARWQGNLENALPSISKIRVVKHHPALPYPEIAGFIKRLRARKGTAAIALEFLILTSARSGEVRGARWQEFDLKKREWIIPAERMKARKEHRVPLSDRAVEILTGIPKGQGDEIVFKAAQGGVLSDMTLGAVLKRMEVPVTTHGFRSTFRDWAGETTAFPREVIEHALAHQLKDKAEAAYARGTLMEKRRKLMAAWAEYCERANDAAGSVIQIRSSH
jgi:integrase